MSISPRRVQQTPPNADAAPPPVAAGPYWLTSRRRPASPWLWSKHVIHLSSRPRGWWFPPPHMRAQNQENGCRSTCRRAPRPPPDSGPASGRGHRDGRGVADMEEPSKNFLKVRLKPAIPCRSIARVGASAACRLDLAGRSGNAARAPRAGLFVRKRVKSNRPTLFPVAGAFGQPFETLGAGTVSRRLAHIVLNIRRDTENRTGA